MNRPCCPRASAKSLASHRGRSRPRSAGTAPLVAVPGTWIQNPWPHARVTGIWPGRPPPGMDRLALRGRYPRLRGLGLHKNFIDRSGAVRSKVGPVGRGRMPGALTRASELSWDLVRRTPPVATRCSRSHIPGPPMHPGGSHVNRSEGGFSVIRPLWGCGRISAPSQLEKAYGCRPTTVIGTAHAAHREDSV